MATTPRLGTMIKRARERKRMSQQQLGDELGVSRSAVNAWERDRAYPRNSIGAIEEILGISLDAEPQAPAAPEITGNDEWERAVLADDTLPLAERRQIIEISRNARARLYPALEPRSEHGASRATPGQAPPPESRFAG